jgi:hypothetical protein
MHEQLAAEAERREDAGAPWPEISELLIKRDWAADALAAVTSGEVKTTVPCELMVVRLGPVAIVALPLEVFVATGQAIKAASPAAVTVVSTNSNGATGYLPTRDAYDERDYTNPEGLAPKVYGVYALAPEAEPLVRERVAALLEAAYAD